MTATATLSNGNGKMADVLDVPLVRPTTVETTALGAAYLAGLAVGYWNGVEEVRDRWQAERRFVPQMPAALRESLRRGWAEAVRRTRS